MKRWLLLITVLLLTVILGACGGAEEEPENGGTGEEGEEKLDEKNEESIQQQQQDSESEEAESEDATADGPQSEDDTLVSLENADGDIVATATLQEMESGVNIQLEGTDLPAGTHGFHIHETGACEGPDFESAGGHYNPTDANHGFDDPEGPHAGDLENIEVSEDGTVTTEVTADMVTLQPEAENTLYTDEGTALVIHSEADDYQSQPSGNAGERIACGVIE
ncbi:superoxide dismutase family protein [Virgibacillus xinjiangensis]|uniref:Superoxide dismutase [Cu-Zn] n=1 Tax=Virgibacillus xinjiangensis TaxID=393090 RepID=A0ABV7CXH5_9BACI